MSNVPPRAEPPSPEDIRELAEQYHLDLSEEEIQAHTELVASRMGALERIDELREPTRPLAHTDRDPGYRPDAAEDPFNAIVTACRVSGDDGPLAGYDVGVKDNIAVASVEMTCGSKVLSGYVPTADAHVIELLLDAGADITAKTNMDEMAVSGSGEMSAFGPVVNPVNDDYLAGGSSGGSAVAVATGRVDVALGTDQAGSIRIPAAWCGCVGLKPTHGLVSYRGAVPLGFSFDHVGPITSTVEDAARVLETIAGPDSLDPRNEGVEAGNYLASLDGSVDDLTIGLLEEGFDEEYTDEGVATAVRDSVGALADAGASVREVSIPYHQDGLFICMAVQLEEIAQIWNADGTGYFVDGHYDTQFAEVFGSVRRPRADSFLPTVKHVFLLGAYLKEQFFGHYHAKAHNLRRDLERAYDEALADVDLLAMPTTPITAFERKSVESRTEMVNRAQSKTGRGRNTMPFNVTGHPAISVPVGLADGLPVGAMLVGGQFAEQPLLRAASTLEETNHRDHS